MTVTTPSGILILDKPAGITSNRLVSQARRKLQTKKIGHAGTLDPMATGLMILGVGRATRLLHYLTKANKSYLATIRLGATTISDDADGTIISDSGCDLPLAEVKSQLIKYLGVIEQVPAMVSAIKVAGQRAYDLVRNGISVELKARKVEIFRLDILAHRSVGKYLDLDVVVDCSSGTYIRSLARDLGQDLGCGGHITALRRTRIGAFGLDLVSEDLLSPRFIAQQYFDSYLVNEAETKEIHYGRTLKIDSNRILPAPSKHREESVIAMLNEQELLALYTMTGKPQAVFIS